MYHPITPPGHGHSAQRPPNAPYLHPRALPPSPYTPSAPLPPAGPSAGPAMLTRELSGYQVSFGLSTPPPSPQTRGLHHSLRSDWAMRLNLAALDFETKLSEIGASLSEPAMHTEPCMTMVIDVIGVLTVRVETGRALSVRDVLSQLWHALQKRADPAYIQQFPPQVQQSANGAQKADPKRRPVRHIYCLGPRVYFAGLEIRRSHNGYVDAYCKLA